MFTPHPPTEPILPPPDAVRLIDLEPHHCRWPVAGAKENTLFCGADQAPSSSYCLEHFRLSRNRQTDAMAMRLRETMGRAA